MNELKLIIFLIIFLFFIYIIYLGLNNRLNLSFLNLKLGDNFKKYFSLNLNYKYPQYPYRNDSKIYYKKTTTPSNLSEDKKTNQINNKNKKDISQTKTEKKELPLGFKENDLSPYYQKISFSFYKKNFSNYFEKIVITNNSEESINITGWYFKTNKGNLFTIPKGIEDYNLNSFLNFQDIVLKPKDKAEIYRGFNPTNIKNFNIRLNKCTGYLNNYYNFQPPLPKQCPTLEIKDLVLLSGECQNFLKNLKACYQPNSYEINKFANEYQCRKYFDELNYGSCYNKYRKDADFFKNEWRIYLKPDVDVFDFNLDSLHDRILLFDKNDLLVGVFVY